MSVIHTSIEVEVPVRIAYDQWTQFEDFPRFMEGVVEVHQTDQVHLHWIARIAGITREWDAKITEQIPDQLLAWTSTGGTRNDGLVTFDALAAHRCEVSLRMDLEPDGVAEVLGDALGLIESRVNGDLRRFKSFVEHRNRPTGSWRGEVDRGVVVTDGPPADTPGEVPASTGGVVDLSRVIGSIPVVLVFVEPLVGPEVDPLVEELGAHLAEFGRNRVQLLVVANVDEETAGLAASWTEGNVRILADADGALADRYGVTYRAGVPTTVLIDSDGDVGAVWVEGPGPSLVDALLRRVERLASS